MSILFVCTENYYRSWYAEQLTFPTAGTFGDIFNVGSGIRQLAGAPAFSPAWSALQQNSSASDLNQDGFVDGLDLGILLGNFDRNGIPASGGELNGVSPVDGLDLGLLLGDWNPQSPSGVAAVPEPRSGVLLMSLVACSILYRHGNYGKSRQVSA